jgi:hypothetical protein
LIGIKEGKPGCSHAADTEKADRRRQMTVQEALIVAGIVAAFVLFAASLAAVSRRR